MSDQKIGILCIQESHLCPEHMTQIDNLYTQRLKVMNSSDPDRPSSSARIAFVLNKEIMNTKNTTLPVIIPGQAAILSINWHNNKKLKILNIYAPNNLSKHKTFWDKIRTEWQRLNLEIPDLMLGDFNLTEDPIDHAPEILDHEAAIVALRDLRINLKVQDRWRLDHPQKNVHIHKCTPNPIETGQNLHFRKTHRQPCRMGLTNQSYTYRPPYGLCAFCSTQTTTNWKREMVLAPRTNIRQQPDKMNK
jgi:hypothetical protein